MRQLRLVGLAEDGASLLLETPSGDAFRLPLDERVRAACRGDLTRLGQIEIEMDNPLRPREIQMRVRAGESAEQIAASSGMPLDRVLRFAYAVLQERGRVVAQARGTAARPKASETLGELVEDRLVSRGTDAGTLAWDAWRRDDGRWSVRLAWRHGDREHAAHWTLDLAKRVLLPDDPAAEQLTAAEYHARTITAVTPLAVAARAAEPARGPERSRPAELNRIPEANRPADPGRAADQGRSPEPGRPARSAEGPDGSGRAGEPERAPRRVVERRPGEPSRRAHRGETAPAAAPAEQRPDFEEIRAGGRRPGSDHRADAVPARDTQPGHRADLSAPNQVRDAQPGRRTDQAAQARDAQTGRRTDQAAQAADQPGRRTDPAAQARDAQTGRRADPARDAQARDAQARDAQPGHRADAARDAQAGRRSDPAAQMRDAQTASGRRADPAGQMRDARVRPESPREPSGSTTAPDKADEPPADEVRQIASGGGTIPLMESEEDRARRATVPSWDDILLGVRRHH